MGNLTKKAILVVSFGTSHEDTRKVTIDELKRQLEPLFPSTGFIVPGQAR